MMRVWWYRIIGAWHKYQCGMRGDWKYVGKGPRGEKVFHAPCGDGIQIMSVRPWH